MAVCRDPFVAQLNDMGFNALRIPRQDFLPGVVLVQSGRQPPTMFGRIDEAFENITPPEHKVASAGLLANATTAKYKRRLGLKIACDWLMAKPASLAPLFDRSSRLSFRFPSMNLLSMPIATCRALLADAEPTENLLRFSENRLFIIYEVLQTKSFVMVVEDGSRKSIDLSTPVFTELGTELGLALDASNARSGVLLFQSDVPHTIGFKAVEIEIAAGDFSLVSASSATGLSHLSQVDAEYHPVLFTEFNRV